MPLVGIYQRDSASSRPITLKAHFRGLLIKISHESLSSRHILKAYYQDPSLGSFIKIHHWDLVIHLQESSTLQLNAMFRCDSCRIHRTWSLFYATIVLTPKLGIRKGADAEQKRLASSTVEA
jgi:hypothetical protein